jgi:hypothetical protein
MKKILYTSFIALILISSMVCAEDGYQYKFSERFQDQIGLAFAKVTMSEEKQIMVRERILERREAHLENNPEDAKELNKYQKDLDKLEEVAPERLRNREQVLNRVMEKLQARNQSVDGIMNALSRAKQNNQGDK